MTCILLKKTGRVMMKGVESIRAARQRHPMKKNDLSSAFPLASILNLTNLQKSIKRFSTGNKQKTVTY